MLNFFSAHKSDSTVLRASACACAEKKINFFAIFFATLDWLDSLGKTDVPPSHWREATNHITFRTVLYTAFLVATSM